MYKIAVIDDEIDILEIVEKYLTRKGDFEVDTYLNPLEALKNKENNYDVILLDVMMPQMNGLDVLEELIKFNPKQKVIIMTAYSTLNTVLESQKKGAAHYLMKPFESLDLLHKKINEIIAS